MARDPIKLPSAMTVSGPTGMRPSGNVAVADPSAIGEGLDALDRGMRGLAQGVLVRKEREDRQRNVSEVSKAEAAWLQESLDIGNAFSEDGDWATFTDRANKSTSAAKESAAKLISDPVVRQQWMDETELKRISLVDSINDRGRALQQQERVVDLGTSLETTSKLITDPDMSDQVREKARKDIKTTIDMAEESGLIEPVDAKKLRDAYITGAEHDLARNRAELDLRFRPEYVRGNVGISSGMTGTDVATAVQGLNGGQPLALDYDTAGKVAELLGDRSLPSDPKLREAYLTDPEVNAKYVEGAIGYLSDRFKGDTSAVIVATVPGGSIELADKWAKSGHDLSVLPASVRKNYETALNSMTPEAEVTHLPVMAAPGVNLEAVDVDVLSRFEATQSVFGVQLPVISGARDPEHNAKVGGAKGSQHIPGKALDIDVSSLSKEERVRFIETASAQGFTGIGVYGNSIHLDTGPRRAWGPTYHGDSVPDWAKEAIDKHLTGKIAAMPAPTKGVAKEYQALTFDDRLALYDRSKVAVDQQRMSMKSGIELDIANAPAAISSTGEYYRDLPNAEDFVAAYGAVEGIDKYKAFDAAVDVAEKSYGMRTMSNQDIEAMVQSAMPTGNADTAEVENKKFEVISQAAKQVLDEREKDPASYAMKVFPAVQEAWQNAGDDPEKFSQAISIMKLAQEQLGIASPQLLPTEVARQAADTFNNLEAPAADRVGAITHLPLATDDPEQQEAIFDQLVAAGVPPMTRGAMAALSRGDIAAAQYLFKAATVDPDKLGLKLPDNVTPPQITQRITEKLFDQNAIGDVIYGLTNATADNLTRLAPDSALIERAVKLHLYDGSATSLDQAIDMTAKEMFGDVQVVTGRSYGGAANVKLVLPKGEDPKPYVDGFTGLRSVVGDAILADLTPTMVGALQSRTPQSKDGNGAAFDPAETAILRQARDQRVSDILENGYFTSAGNGGFVFVDASTGQAIPDPYGQGPLTFTRDDVITASVGQEARRGTGWGSGTPGPVRGW